VGARQDGSLSLFFFSLFFATTSHMTLTSPHLQSHHPCSHLLHLSFPPVRMRWFVNLLSPAVYHPWGPVVMTDINGCNSSSSSSSSTLRWAGWIHLTCKGYRWHSRKLQRTYQHPLLTFPATCKMTVCNAAGPRPELALQVPAQPRLHMQGKCLFNRTQLGSLAGSDPDFDHGEHSLHRCCRHLLCCCLPSGNPDNEPAVQHIDVHSSVLLTIRSGMSLATLTLVHQGCYYYYYYYTRLYQS
jgi:hypothetical protein